MIAPRESAELAKTHSRLYISNDNPYSESQFRTTKYRPAFPDRFGGPEDSHAFCQRFLPWYNNDHARLSCAARHLALHLLRPGRLLVSSPVSILGCTTTVPTATPRFNTNDSKLTDTSDC